MTVETVHAVILESGNHFAVTTETETAETFVLTAHRTQFRTGGIYLPVGAVMLFRRTGHRIGTFPTLIGRTGIISFKTPANAHNAILNRTLCAGCTRKRNAQKERHRISVDFHLVSL